MKRRQISITFMNGPQDGRTIQWDTPTGQAEKLLTIGRRDGCDIPLDYDTQVSRLHARVVYVPLSASFYLEDAGSRNGTYIGGDRLIDRTPLVPGVLFRVGRTWMRLDEPHAGADGEGDDDEE